MSHSVHWHGLERLPCPAFAPLTIQSESVARHPIQRPLWGLAHSCEGRGDQGLSAVGAGVRGVGQREGVCQSSHLVLVHLDRLHLLGCAEVCGERAASHVLTSRACSHPCLQLPPSPPGPAHTRLQLPPYPKAAQTRPRCLTAPRGSAPAAPDSGCSLCGPAGPAVGEGSGQEETSGGPSPNPEPRPVLTVKVPVSRSMVCSWQSPPARMREFSCEGKGCV